jgi:hypothetical protein
MGVATGGSRRRARDIGAGHQHGVGSSLSNRRYLTVTRSVPTFETPAGILDGGWSGSGSAGQSEPRVVPAANADAGAKPHGRLASVGELTAAPRVRTTESGDGDRQLPARAVAGRDAGFCHS